MSRSKRADLDDLSGPVVSAIDTFGGALGAALAMLLVLSTLNRTPVQQAGAGARVPTILTLQWNALEPAYGGLGPATLHLRLRRSDGAVSFEQGRPPPSDCPSWTILPSVGQRWNKPNSPPEPDRTVASVAFTAAAMPSGSRWEVEARLTWETPLEWAGDPNGSYARLLARVDDLRGRFHGGKVGPSAFLDELRKELDSYLTYARDLARFARGWADVEAGWLRQPSRDRAWLAEGVERRMGLVRDLLKQAATWTYPDGAEFAALRKGAEPCPVTTEPTVTRWLAEEFAAADDPVRVRFRFVQALRELAAGGFKLPIELSFTSAGGKELVGERLAFPEVLPVTAAEGWLPVGTLAVDARGQARFTPVLPCPADQPAGLPRDPKPDAPPSRWDAATARFLDLGASALRADQRQAILERVDQALHYLAEHQKGQPDGKFSDPEARFVGPGTTGLALLAFVARGHEVGLPGSRYREVVDRAVEFIVSRVEAEDYRGDAHSAHYHLGFTLLALADTLPGAERNAAPLAGRMRQALAKTVEYTLKKQAPCGGWGYDSPHDPGDDTSVTVVVVKGLVEARAALRGDAALVAKIGQTLERAGAFFAQTRESADKFYRYRLSAPGPDRIHRQPGCLLAEHLCGSAGSAPFDPARDGFTQEVFAKIVAWQRTLQPDTFGTGGFDHYALFYGAHLLSLHRDSTARADWFASVRRLMLAVRQDARYGEFLGGTYGNAMTVIQLLLPLRLERERLTPPPGSTGGK